MGDASLALLFRLRTLEAHDSDMEKLAQAFALDCLFKHGERGLQHTSGAMRGRRTGCMQALQQILQERGTALLVSREAVSSTILRGRWTSRVAATFMQGSPWHSSCES